jgi:hypothetical protein
LALECPTKLYYTKKDEYPNANVDDPFIMALAEGGYQVGALAKCYYPDGHDITTLDYDEAVSGTKELLLQDKVTIFEPAISFKNLFIRIDILLKKRNSFELIEVKATSFEDTEEKPFLNKNGSIQAGWKSYLYDIAFQKYVLSKAYPKSKISCCLMMVDKNSVCQVDGLNQKIRIIRDESNRKGIKVLSFLKPTDLKDQILIKVPVDDVIDLILIDKSFIAMIKEYATAYEQDEKITSSIGSHCGSCEFKCSKEEESQGYKSGFKECWKKKLGWKDKDFNDENVLEIWNCRKRDHFIEENKIFKHHSC